MPTYSMHISNRMFTITMGLKLKTPAIHDKMELIVKQTFHRSEIYESI